MDRQHFLNALLHEILANQRFKPLHVTVTHLNFAYKMQFVQCNVYKKLTEEFA